MSDTTTMVLTGLAILVLGVLYAVWIVQGNRRLPAVVLGAGYVYALLSMTILRQKPYPVRRAETEFFHSYRIVLHGFATGWGWGMLIEIIGNVLMFMPLGMMLSRVLRGSRWVWVVLIVGLVCSLSIESVQYFKCLGIFELDDLFHNTLGTLLGYLAGGYLRQYREWKDEEGIRYVLRAMRK